MLALSNKEKSSVFHASLVDSRFSDLGSRTIWRSAVASKPLVSANPKLNVSEPGIAIGCGSYAVASTLFGLDYPVGVSAFTQAIEMGVNLTGVGYEIPTMLSEPQIIFGSVFYGQGEDAPEEDVVEFRCLAPRVESIAALRDKVKLTKTATDFAKGVRLRAFRIEEDVEEQSE